MRSSIERFTERVHRLSDGIIVAAAPASDADIGALAECGVRTIIDLRGEGDPVYGLRPAAEAASAAAHGLIYEHIPLAVSSLDRSTVDQIRVALWAAEPQVLLHCGSGRRAWLCALIHLGCQHGWTVDRCLDLATAHGVDMDEMPALRGFLRRYVETNSRAYGNHAVAARPTDSYQI